jgi:hypothetical protein
MHIDQNGKLLRSLKSHTVAVVCLNWEEEGQLIRVCRFLSPLMSSTRSLNKFFCSLPLNLLFFIWLKLLISSPGAFFFSHFHCLFKFGFQDDSKNSSSYEDRTSRFFPPAPRVPRMPGVVSGDTGFMDDSEDSYRELSNSSYQRFNILCSGDKDGSICFSIFGIFPIGKIVSYTHLFFK